MWVHEGELDFEKIAEEVSLGLRWVNKRLTN